MLLLTLVALVGFFVWRGTSQASPRTPLLTTGGGEPKPTSFPNIPTLTDLPSIPVIVPFRVAQTIAETPSIHTDEVLTTHVPATVAESIQLAPSTTLTGIATVENISISTAPMSYFLNRSEWDSYYSDAIAFYNSQVQAFLNHEISSDQFHANLTPAFSWHNFDNLLRTVKDPTT